MNILAIGASRNVGYHACLRFLGKRCNVTFMLRSPSIFDNDETIQSYVRAGKAHLVKGDCLVESDVQHAWEAALSHGPVDLMLFTLGTTKGSFHPLKGFVISPPNLVANSLINVLCTMPKDQSPPPKLIAISANGLTRASHAALPIAMRALYTTLLGPAHKDKLGAERAVAHCAGWAWNDDEPKEDILWPHWREKKGLPAPGTLSNILILRPMFFTDGKCKADGDGPGYNIIEAPAELRGSYTISRKDVAHFVANAALNHWDKYKDKIISLGY